MMRTRQRQNCVAERESRFHVIALDEACIFRTPSDQPALGKPQAASSVK